MTLFSHLDSSFESRIYRKTFLEHSLHISTTQLCLRKVSWMSKFSRYYTTHLESFRICYFLFCSTQFESYLLLVLLTRIKLRWNIILEAYYSVVIEFKRRRYAKLLLLLLFLGGSSVKNNNNNKGMRLSCSCNGYVFLTQIMLISKHAVFICNRMRPSRIKDKFSRVFT